MFGSERQNVIKACDIVRHSPLIGPKIPVHGLLIDIETGKLDWIVNGYRDVADVPAASCANRWLAPSVRGCRLVRQFQHRRDEISRDKIGEYATKAEDWLSKQAGKIETGAAETIGKAAPVAESVQKIAGQVVEFAGKERSRPPEMAEPPPMPPKIPMPPPIRPKIIQPRNKR